MVTLAVTGKSIVSKQASHFTDEQNGIVKNLEVYEKKVLAL